MQTAIILITKLCSPLREGLNFESMFQKVEPLNPKKGRWNIKKIMDSSHMISF